MGIKLQQSLNVSPVIFFISISQSIKDARTHYEQRVSSLSKEGRVG